MSGTSPSVRAMAKYESRAMRSRSYPLKYASTPCSSLKPLKPSSCHAKRRSSEPTCIGNHMCPVSWTWTEYNDKVSRGPPMHVSMGYSMPEHDVGPSSAVICGHGYGQRYFDRNSTELR